MDTIADPTLRPARAGAGPMEIYRSTKSYDHNEGLSCCFRQWRADSHCRLVHGYALAVKLVFATPHLDHRNWCLDFGSLKPVKAWLHDLLDHTMIAADDDPELPRLQDLAAAGLVDLRILPAVGCEALAKHVHDHVSQVTDEMTKGRVSLESVEIREHAGNSAIYEVRANWNSPAALP
ncbi:6-carboxytetrahydropterin synthase [Neorhizobium sp. IRAMC:178]|uniref:6-pyruvoyl trahydropterin synthase family protein n=1 Tax=Neorhizobium tunisiense TaxID=3144793 RepID=UPI0031F5FB02